MKQSPSLSHGKKKNLWFITFLIIIFPAQQLVVSTPFSPIRLYMIVFAFLGVFLIIQNFVFSKTLYYKYDDIDIAIGSVFIYMLFSSLWADNVLLALQMAAGIIILLFVYLIFRVILSGQNVNELKAACMQASKLFVVVSFSYYVLGLIQHYIIGAPLVVKEGYHVAYMYGVYFEGGIIPRLRGICDSPNNFGMYAVFFLASLFLGDKKSKFYIISILILMVLTLSYTTYLALLLMIIVFLVKRYGIQITGLFGLLVTGTLVIYVINSSLLESIMAEHPDNLHRIFTGSGRWELFSYSLQSFSDQPLIGYGLNQAREILEPLRHDVRSSHNNFIEILLEGGLVGFSVYLCGLAILIIKGRSLKGDRNLSLWAIGLLFGLFVFSNANVTLYADSTILVLAVLASMSAPKYFRIKDLITEENDVVSRVELRPEYNEVTKNI